MTLFRLVVACILLFAMPAVAQVADFPSGFRTERVATPDAEIHVRVGGRGPAVVLLHGYTQTGDMWAPLAAELARTHTVIVPDLRGLGLSSRPASGYDKKTQATDVVAVLDRLDIRRTAIVGHDIGNMVAYAVVARYPDRITRLVVMDAPVPGLGPWEEVVRNRALWHFSFGGSDAERLVEGRERIYLDRFWNEFAADPAKITEGTRAHYAQLYAQPGAMRAGFAQFAAFAQDAVDNAVSAKAAKITTPVLAVGGGKSFGSMMATVMRAGAVNVEEAVIPNAGYWLMEEQPAATIAAVSAFLSRQSPMISSAGIRLRPDEYVFPSTSGPTVGTSGTLGIQTAILKGDPMRTGLYTILLRIPPNTRIDSHTHRDDRVAMVVSGDWSIGYGPRFDAKKLKRLPPGGFYSEPPSVPHFAMTGAQAAIVSITGYGPTDSRSLSQANEPMDVAHD